MKILVVGAGATGGYFGGRLAASGADVTFLVRPQRAENLARYGLRIESGAGSLSMPVQTTLADGLKPRYDLAVLSCKAYDLDSALAALMPGLHPDSIVVPLLNGLRHLDRMTAVLGAGRVAGGLCDVGATLAADGTIRHLTSFQRIVFGMPDGSTPPALIALREAFARTPVQFRFSTTIVAEMWDKFVFLTAVAGTTCLLRASIGDLVETDSGVAIGLELLEECKAVAYASGHTPDAKYMARAQSLLNERGSTFTASMLRDMEQGRAIEAEHIVGDMLDRARTLGAKVPLLRIVWTHLQAYEARRRREQAALAPA